MVVQRLQHKVGKSANIKSVSQGRSTKFWTLYIGILYGPVPTSTALNSSILVGLFHTWALYTQYPLSPQSYAPGAKTKYP